MRVIIADTSVWLRSFFEFLLKGYKDDMLLLVDDDKTDDVTNKNKVGDHKIKNME